MRALVTGSRGFIGRHMAAALKARGWIVDEHDSAFGYDTMALFREPVQATYRYDLIVPAAYYVGGRAAIDGDRRNLARNLALDAAMFNWAVHTRQHRILYWSSSAVYPVYLQGPKHPHLPKVKKVNDYRLQEGDADIELQSLNPSAPDVDYGFAKLVGERLAENARAMGVKVHVVRPFSGYGEDQDLTYPFPAIIDRVKRGDTTVWGPVGQTRDWIHVSDVIAGALAVVEADCEEPVNLCTGLGTEFGDFAQMVIDLLRAQGEPFFSPVMYDESKPTGVFRRVGDPSFMETFYKPKVSLEEGVRRALARGPQ